MVLAPVFAICAIVVLLDTGFPVLFRARRKGLYGQDIEVLKFRTMSVSQDGPAVTVGGDSRVTASGKLLRSTKLDEIPQLVNVLRGEMSLVGPRPEDPKYVSLYPNEFDEILSVRPGITGVASVEFRDEEQILQEVENPQEYYESTLLPQKLDLESQYVLDRTLRLNLRILMDTVRVVVTPSR